MARNFRLGPCCVSQVRCHRSARLRTTSTAVPGGRAVRSQTARSPVLSLPLLRLPYSNRWFPLADAKLESSPAQARSCLAVTVAARGVKPRGDCSATLQAVSLACAPGVSRRSVLAGEQQAFVQPAKAHSWSVAKPQALRSSARPMSALGH